MAKFGPKPIPMAERFARYFIPEPNTGCWIWVGSDNGRYGQLKSNRKTWMAHRVAYELHVGPIPSGMEIDHECRVALCVNPDHLRAVTPLQNMRAIPAGMRGNNQIRTHCREGHALSGKNLKFDSRGHARCAECSRRYFRQRYLASREGR